MKIIGAGLAGLLAGNMMRHHAPTIIEQQPSLPNNHSAVLRFRSSIVGDTLNIPFKKVQMIKTSVPWRNPVADALAYSFKNTGTYRSDRSITAGLVAEERYIAPSDLIHQMAVNCNIELGKKFDFTQDPGPVISTIPLPLLASILGYKERFDPISTPAVHIRATIKDCDAYVSLVDPDPRSVITRTSITGDELIIETNLKELPSDEEVKRIIREVMVVQLGLQYSDRAMNPTTRLAKYAKIAPIDDGARKRFIAWASDKHNVYSLGRFATWRANLLLDAHVQDIRLIDRWVRDGRYGMARHR